MNVNEYYSYIIIYVDVVFVVDKDPVKYMNIFKDNYMVTKGFIEVPMNYLGVDMSKVDYNNPNHYT